MSLLHGMAELTLMDNDEDEASRYVEEYIKMDGGDINHANLLNNLALHTTSRAMTALPQLS